MNLENQVCSLELSKRIDALLKERGVKYESLFWHYQQNRSGNPNVHGSEYEQNDQPWHIFWGSQPSELSTFSIYEEYPAYTVAELGEMLPKNENLVMMFFENGRCQMCLQGNVENDEGIATRWGAAGQSVEGETEVDCRAKMLIYLLENKLVTL